MKNNVDPKMSFNSWDISIEKSLNAPKSALFADSTFLEWGLFWEIFSNRGDLPCLVRFQQNARRSNEISFYWLDLYDL